MEKGSILHQRWVKPAHRRARGQRTAHLLLAFENPDTANQAITAGVKINQHRSRVRKLLQEPRRCAKCQIFTNGHFAADCKQTHDTCAKCSKEHCTEHCNITNPIFFFCSNCQAPGHATFDRLCPTFLQLKEQYDNWYPSNRFIYLPTADTKHGRKLVKRTLPLQSPSSLQNRLSKHPPFAPTNLSISCTPSPSPLL